MIRTNICEHVRREVRIAAHMRGTAVPQQQTALRPPPPFPTQSHLTTPSPLVHNQSSQLQIYRSLLKWMRASLSIVCQPTDRPTQRWAKTASLPGIFFAARATLQATKAALRVIAEICDLHDWQYFLYLHSRALSISHTMD
jgi:hypothetical protein